MSTRTRVLAAGAVAGFGLVALAGPAMADNAAVSINKVGTLSATKQTAYVKATVICSEDTQSGIISATLQQVVANGDVQKATSVVAALNAVECSGEEEDFTLPVRRPTGGYKWQKGTASVRNFRIVTQDPSGTYFDTLKARTITLR